MTLLHALILSLVEGITEFLPVSSTGHLILFSHLLKIPTTEFLKSFEIIIQLGAILAVFLLYWRQILLNEKLWIKVSVAFLPSAVLGLIFYKFIKNYLMDSPQIVLISLLVGGIFLIVLEGINSRRKNPGINLKTLSYKNSLLIGFFQCFSLIPGVSRSAATIFGGLISGVDRKSAVEFSFLLAIPTMVAASGLDIVKNYEIILNGSPKLLLIGFIGSFVTATFAIKLFLGFVEKHTFLPFAFYRIFVSILFWFIIF